jgi:deferrochelatase/peroxidase EfeB
MTEVRLHRIIRHGTAYGPPLPDGVFEDDGQARGIFFIFLSATAPDTYEFLKKEWINNGNFLGIGTERDPIAGGHDGSGQFTIPMRPLRRKIPMLESFTRTLGGEYAFMPSLTALRWLAELRSA